jgi:AcrR family transcriptional regulator
MLDTPNRDRTAERREATRQEILAAAWTIARTDGLAAITLKDIGQLVGMRAPSLYSHFPSKSAIYDAMFGQAWAECHAVLLAAAERAPEEPRARLTYMTRTFFDFCVRDPERHQLMNTRAIPGFTPSPASYQPAVEALELTRDELHGLGVTDDEVDLIVAIVGGLIDAQIANDLGGDRWSRLLDRAIDMFADNVGLAGATRREA